MFRTPLPTTAARPMPRSLPVTLRFRAVAPRAAALLAGALLAACDGGGGRAMSAAGDGADSMGVVPAARRIATRNRAELVESSAAVMSVTQPGVLFTINDSGHEPLLFAVDTTGADRGAWRVSGARNRDWEAAALGPCGSGGDAGAAAAGPASCVYIGDVGDNGAEHAAVMVYRVREPRAARGGRTGAVPAERIRFRYADGPHDVEAMLVGGDGTMHFITKRPLTDASGRKRPALVFTLPAAAWREPRALHVAALADSLPIVPGTAVGRQITDAALAPDGRWAAVRTYVQVYVFAAEPATGRIRTDVAPSVCNVVDLDERQGEGITWLGASGPLLLTSEGRREPLRVIDCPRPRE